MNSVVIVFGVPLALLAGLYWYWQNNAARKAARKLKEAKESGLLEPASLHPVIDPQKCLGCGTCVSACPEGEILGLINRKAVLVSPTSCIGHGACQEACPTGAISLVFGTATRGVEIPLVSPDFESSVPGIYIAGELGGMGLIKNAIAQGKQAVEAIAGNRKAKGKTQFDLVIVGAGPAGLSAALMAKVKKLRFILLEQDTVGGTVAHYPRGKIVMTQPADLPIVGKFQFREASKEKLIDFWNEVIIKIEDVVKTGCQVGEISKVAEGFEVNTNKGLFTTDAVLLTMGRRGTPRKLDVPGEDLNKVVYRLIDAEQYRNSKVLVVGGGDSALEAALAIADETGTKVTLSYRSPSFSRAKAKNRERVDAAAQEGKLDVLLQSNVKIINHSSVEIEHEGKVTTIENDAVIICAGGVLPTPFLKRAGIHVEEKFGTA